jgi:hypothetical protein
MKFLKWRLRNKTGLFGSLWYLAMTFILVGLSQFVPEVRCFSLFLAFWSFAAFLLWFILWE